MKVLILGCGNIGSVAAEDLANLRPIEVFVADKIRAKAEKVAERIHASNVSAMQLDASNYNTLVNTLKDFDLIMGFLPGSHGYRLAKASIEAKRDLVDVSYMHENPLTFNNKALKANVTVLPDCGLAPGISNILVGYACKRLDRTQTVRIMVGGLPETPMPPLDYVVTFSVETLIDEYTRKVRIVRDGKIANVEALIGLEEVILPHLGKLEAFYTDGLRTLLYTIKDVKSMWEKTIRYPGHAERIKLLKALGFFEEKQIDLDGRSISPRKLTAKLFEQKLQRSEVRDIVVMKVQVSGIKEGNQVCYTYNLFDRYDKTRKITAMARTTAYTASIIGRLILENGLKEKGVIPPEKLGMSERFFSKFSGELERRRIHVTELLEKSNY